MESAALLQALLGGAATGGVYALIAAALALIYGKLRVVDFVDALALMLALFGISSLVLEFRLDPLAALPAAAAVALMFGFLLQRLTAAWAGRGRRGDPLTFGIAFTVVALYWMLNLGAGQGRFWVAETMLQLPGFSLPLAKVLAFFGAVLASGLLVRMIDCTALGRSIHALATGQEGAATPQLLAVAFGIACACFAAAACLLVPGREIQTEVEGGFVATAFAIVVLGARGRLRDAVIGGMAIGVVEAVGVAWLGGVEGALCVALLALVLLLDRIDGLFTLRRYAAVPLLPHSR